MFARIAIVALIAVVAWATFVRPSEGYGGERTYVVQPADTLWSIAATRYADPRKGVYELRERNGLSGTLLVPGQTLVLP